MARTQIFRQRRGNASDKDDGACVNSFIKPVNTEKYYIRGLTVPIKLWAVDNEGEIIREKRVTDGNNNIHLQKVVSKEKNIGNSKRQK